MNPAERINDWRGRLKGYTLVVTAISVTAAAVIGIMNAAGIFEPYWITTHRYARLVVLSSEIMTLESNRDNLQSQVDALEFKLKNTDNAYIYRIIWREQIERRKEELRQVESQLKDLYRQQGNFQ